MIFCPNQRAHNIARSTPYLPAHDFLIARVWDDIADRIQVIKQNFSRTLILSDRGADGAISGLKNTCKITDNITIIAPDHNGILNIEPGTFDLAISVFDAHVANDLQTFLFQLRAALAPNGVCFIAMPGGETLADVRDCLTRAEIDITGGAAPRIHPFIDRASLAGLMQNAGFSLPVIDHDTITIDYTTTARAFADIRGMGETNCLASRSRRFAPRHLFTHAEDLYRLATHSPSPNPLPVKIEILHASGWA